MDILSFDIGIKNLAYCRICKDTKNIKQWGILNVSCDELCNHISSKGISCDKSATYTIEGNYYCPSHCKLKYNEGKKKKKIKSNNTIYNIGKNIINQLDKTFESNDYGQVIVENQPSLKNPTMKSIQMIVYTYFLIKSDIIVEMINARNKLKVYNGPVILTPYTNEAKNKYKNNKFLAIKYCSSMIEDQQTEFIDLYKTSKKKDDLADCYLQAIYWINK